VRKVISEAVYIQLDGDYGFERVRELARTLEPATKSRKTTLDLRNVTFSHSSAFSVLIITRLKMLNQCRASVMVMAGLSEHTQRLLHASGTGKLFSLNDLKDADVRFN
jgi:anti-anti-sigma factor